MGLMKIVVDAAQKARELKLKEREFDLLNTKYGRDSNLGVVEKFLQHTPETFNAEEYGRILESGQIPTQRQSGYESLLDTSPVTAGVNDVSSNSPRMKQVPKMEPIQVKVKPRASPADLTPITVDETWAQVTGRPLGEETTLGALKQAAALKRSNSGTSGNSPLNQDVSDYVYQILGQDPQGKKVLTVRDASTALRAKGIDTQEFFADLGIELKLGRDALGEQSPEAKAAVQAKRQARTAIKPTMKARPEAKAVAENKKPVAPSAPQQLQIEPTFNTVEEAEAAGLPANTIVVIGGRRARIK